MISREELEKAAKTYDGNKYSEEFYAYHLKILQNSDQVNESVKKSVEYLILWKLGKIRSKRTPTGAKIDFKDSIGNQYYSINLPKTQTRVIGKAIEKERLKKAIDFSKNLCDLSEFKHYADDLTSSSIVIPTF